MRCPLRPSQRHDAFSAPLNRCGMRVDERTARFCTRSRAMREVKVQPRLRPSRRLRGVLAVTMALIVGAAGEVQAEDVMRLQSAYSFGATLARLRSVLEAKGFGIFAEFDHRAAAQAVDLEMPPTTVLVYGNPRGGTPLMIAAPDFALELPLRVLVREGADGNTYVTFNPSSSLEGKHGLPAGMAARLAPPETLIAEAVAPARVGEQR